MSDHTTLQDFALRSETARQACPTASFPILRRPACSYGEVAKWAALVAVELPPM